MILPSNIGRNISLPQGDRRVIDEIAVAITCFDLLPGCLGDDRPTDRRRRRWCTRVPDDERVRSRCVREEVSPAKAVRLSIETCSSSSSFRG